ncbi:MAG TPA: hypothetical protein DEP47_01205 [Chloroflexi bacterium]|nr:hypothetical protein [Chloroflexota bacterium]
MHLLIATGGDEHSEQAVRLGAQLARTAQGAVTILTIVEDENDRSKADAILTQASSLVGSEEIEVKSKVSVGEIATEIVREAEDGNCDLLVIGSRPSHGFLKRLLGPTSERVMAHSPCPVLIAKGKARSFHNVLVCSSGANGYEGPSRAVTHLASIFSGSEITLLHVMSQISASPDVREGWQLQATASELMEEDTPEGRLLEERVEMLERSGFQVKAKVRHGLVVDEILEESHSGNYDLVVIGAHSTTGWKRFLLDDVAHQLVIQLDRPVLVVQTR